MQTQQKKELPQEPIGSAVDNKSSIKGTLTRSYLQDELSRAVALSLLLLLLFLFFFFFFSIRFLFYVFFRNETKTTTSEMDKKISLVVMHSQREDTQSAGEKW